MNLYFESYPETDCPSCGGLNLSCPNGCGRDSRTGELDGTRLLNRSTDNDFVYGGIDQ